MQIGIVEAEKGFWQIELQLTFDSELQQESTAENKTTESNCSARVALNLCWWQEASVEVLTTLKKCIK